MRPNEDTYTKSSRHPTGLVCGGCHGCFLGHLSTCLDFEGKEQTLFRPQYRLGDFVIVINAEKVKLTGLKAEQKLYKALVAILEASKRPLPEC